MIFPIQKGLQPHSWAIPDLHSFLLWLVGGPPPCCSTFHWHNWAQGYGTAQFSATEQPKLLFSGINPFCEHFQQGWIQTLGLTSSKTSHLQAWLCGLESLGTTGGGNAAASKKEAVLALLALCNANMEKDTASKIETKTSNLVFRSFPTDFQTSPCTVNAVKLRKSMDAFNSITLRKWNQRTTFQALPKCKSPKHQSCAEAPFFWQAMVMLHYTSAK